MRSSCSIRAAPACSSSPNTCKAGLKGQIPLYTVFTIDELSLPRLKDLAVGIPGAQEWVNDLPNEANKKFVADYIAKYKITPVVLRRADL